MALAEERCNAMGSECVRDHAAAEAAITELKDIANRTAAHVTGDTLLLSCTELINGTLHWLLLRDRI